MVETGLGRLLAEPRRWLRGRRFGLITNNQARGPDGVPGWRSLRSACVADLICVFTPEHGISAREADAAEIPSTSTDGLQLHSLYGPGGRTAPQPWMLDGLDLLLLDLQDVGARFYTYLSTMLECLRVAAPRGIPVMILDRPNPLGGVLVEGPGLDPAYRSFVADIDVPVCHGLTLGELGLLARKRLALQEEAVEVLPMAGWHRDMTWEETGLVWYPPSPAATSPGMVRVYPGTCLIEGTTASEGRGTDMPFELVGAACLDGDELARELARMRPPDVPAWASAAPASFIPREGKQAGVLCGGVRLAAPPAWTCRTGPKDAASFSELGGGAPGPLAFGVALLQAVFKQGCEAVAWRQDVSGRYWLDLLMGGPEVRRGLQDGAGWAEIAALWRARQAAHRAETADSLLYRVAAPGVARGRAPSRAPVALDLLPPQELARVFVASAADAVEACMSATGEIAEAIRLTAARLSRGGRLVYVGAGTSGRLGALDASECEPTFGVEPGRVIALVAGGDQALRRSAEGAEDDTAAAEIDLERAGVGPADVVVGISASGTTPYTVSALRAARRRRALAVALVSASASRLAGAADLVIQTPTGDEPLEGSTRLNAGTAQKIVLNALTTGVFSLLGYVFESKMVGVQPVNAKLWERAVGLVAGLAGVSPARASAVLGEARRLDPRLAVRTAVLSLRAGLGAAAARDLLIASGCSLRRALEAAAPEKPV